MAAQPSISVLIRTFNSEKTLDQVLTALDLKERDECIIVDSGSTDTTLDIAATHNARILRVGQPFNYSRSLNVGFSEARCDWVLVLSSHCIPLRPDLLARMGQVASTTREDIAVIYGRISLYDPGQSTARTVIGDQEDWKARRFAGGGNGFAMYPRKYWEMHRFDEELVTAEDLDWLAWALSKDYKAALVMDAIVLYRNQGCLIHMFRKGWNETLQAKSINETINVKKPFIKAIKSLLINSFYLTKLLVAGRFGISSYLRMLAHGLGSELSNIMPMKPLSAKYQSLK